MTIDPLLAIFIGVIGGFILASIVAAFLIRLSYRRGRLESEPELATLRERASQLSGTINELRDEIQRTESKLLTEAKDREDCEIENASLRERLKNQLEEIESVKDIEKRFTDTFKALSSEALKSNSQSLIELANQNLSKFQEGAKGDLEKRQQAIDQMVKPIQESLASVGKKIEEIEKERAGSFATLAEKLRSLTDSNEILRGETRNLVQALKAPSTRGRWGEIQLKRVVELAGMVEHCDFAQQETIGTEQGDRRPDLTVKLPNSKSIVVDSKAPLSAYLEALEATDENIRQEKLRDHAKQVKRHLSELGSKAYWEKLKDSPEFVVMFLPGETFFGAALEQDPELIEHGVKNRVIIATPTTLIALLKAVAFGWKQEQLATNAVEISKLGKLLYERLSKMTSNFVALKKGLENAITAYNGALGSLESRVLPTARKFKELGISSEEGIKELEGIEESPKNITAPDLVQGQ